MISHQHIYGGTHPAVLECIVQNDRGIAGKILADTKESFNPVFTDGYGNFWKMSFDLKRFVTCLIPGVRDIYITESFCFPAVSF